MRGRLRAFALVVLVVCGAAIAFGATAHRDGNVSPKRESAVIAHRVTPAVASSTTPRPTRERLPSLLAVLAALVLATAVIRRADRPRFLPLHAAAASTTAPSRAPPSPQNLAF